MDASRAPEVCETTAYLAGSRFSAGDSHVAKWHAPGWSQILQPRLESCLFLPVAPGTITDSGPPPVDRFFSYGWNLVCVLPPGKQTHILGVPGCPQILQPRLESCLFSSGSGHYYRQRTPDDRFFSQGWNLVCVLLLTGTNTDAGVSVSDQIPSWC